MMDELRAYLCGWLTVRVGQLTPFVDWIGTEVNEEGEVPDRFLPHFALGAAHGLGAGPRSYVPLLTTVAVTDEIERLAVEQRRAPAAQHDRPLGPQCDVIREGRTGAGKLVNGRAVFHRLRSLVDRFVDWIAADAAHCRG